MGLKDKLQKATAAEPKLYNKVFKGRDATAFLDLARRKVNADRKKKEAESELEEIKEDLLIRLLQSGEDSLGLWDGLVIKIGRGATGDKIDGRALLEKGVPMQTILDCTIEGRPTEFVQVVTPKGAK